MAKKKKKTKSAGKTGSKKPAAGKSGKRAPAQKKMAAKKAVSKSGSKAKTRGAAAKVVKVTKKKVATKKVATKKIATKSVAAKKITAKKGAAKKVAAKKIATTKVVKAAKKSVESRKKKILANQRAATKKSAAAAATKAAAKKGKRKAETSKAAAGKEAPAADAKSPRLRSQPVEVQEIDVQIQRERKSRLKPFQPRSYGSKPKKMKPSEALDLVTKYMGKAPSLSEKQQPKTVVELGIFCIFALGGNSARVSLEATKRLVTEFPEWNEFRVSEAYEFLEVMDGLNLVEPYDRCEQVLEYVNEVYQDQNAVDLEFLRDMTPEDRLVALNRYRSLGPALSHYMALALQDFKGILFHYSWARVIQRAGLVPRTGSPKALVASTEKAFDGLDTITLQINLIDLGEVICNPKSPQCRSCYLVHGCKSRKV